MSDEFTSDEEEVDGSEEGMKPSRGSDEVMEDKQSERLEDDDGLTQSEDDSNPFADGETSLVSSSSTEIPEKLRPETKYMTLSHNQRKVTLVVFGHRGNGKSTLSNTLIGDNTGTSFRESPNPEEETKETVAKTGIFDGVEICVIDTPDCGGGEGNAEKPVVNMADFIIANTEVQAFVLVLNFQASRWNEDLKSFFQLFTGMYPGKPWLPHLAVVWTRCYPEYSNDTEMKARRAVLKKGMKMFMPEVTNAKLDSIPQFFIDSKDARTPGTRDRDQLGQMIAWAATKPPVSHLGVIRVKKGAPIVERRTRQQAGDQWETGYHHGSRIFLGVFGPRHYHHVVHQTFTKIFEEREKQEYTSGEPTYSDWKQVRSETSERIVSEYDT